MIPFDGSRNPDDGIFRFEFLQFKADFCIFSFAQNFKKVIGGSKHFRECFIAAVLQLVDQIDGVNFNFVFFPQIDGFFDVLPIVHAGYHSGYQNSHTNPVLNLTFPILNEISVNVTAGKVFLL